MRLLKWFLDVIQTFAWPWRLLLDENIVFWVHSSFSATLANGIHQISTHKKEATKRAKNTVSFCCVYEITFISAWLYCFVNYLFLQSENAKRVSYTSDGVFFLQTHCYYFGLHVMSQSQCFLAASNYTFIQCWFFLSLIYSYYAIKWTNGEVTNISIQPHTFTHNIIAFSVCDRFFFLCNRTVCFSCENLILSASKIWRSSPSTCFHRKS